MKHVKHKIIKWFLFSYVSLQNGSHVIITNHFCDVLICIIGIL